ncbi:HD-GYP domain-containing protein [Azoarcus sp. KH32C]|uniref:HD-GYP domain-containing protein n=1 Tax=Azoarcus sp. KH32C TaxID=748247 RepID=UPI0002385F52|nr:HD-GYP domain-containing protein [Azoarcus sp. KH32C]BAL26706.1 metal dependent phosphohydrolase [Azoarcus sp. KH32C]
MIKLIRIEQLAPGMFIHDLNCDWTDHDFIRNQFLVADAETVARVGEIGVHEIYIDTSRGGDVADAPTEDDRRSELDATLGHIAAAPQPRLESVSRDAELQRARRLQGEAEQIVRGVMGDVRIGKQIELEKVEPLVEKIVASIFRQPDALLPLLHLKDHDDYTFMHSVSVCALLTSFARTLELPREVIKEISIGALLHDVGKAKVPDGILNKPAKLTDAEFDKMKSHVVQSKIILQHTPGISEIALDVAAEHHERFDGTGYPNKLKGSEISLYGQMGAIVDVYDAITSNRVYHKGMPPTQALRKLLEWSKYHFDPKLVHAFIRSVGIYPSGSLVRLESGKLAVVQAQNMEHLLQPTVLVMFDAIRRCYLTPQVLDLAKSKDVIIEHEDFDKWQIDPARWIAAG